MWITKNIDNERYMATSNNSKNDGSVLFECKISVIYNRSVKHVT